MMETQSTFVHRLLRLQHDRIRANLIRAPNTTSMCITGSGRSI